MADNTKTPIDTKSYYQSLKDMAQKTKEAFSQIGNTTGNVFSGIRKNLTSLNGALKDFVPNIIAANNVLNLIQRGFQAIFSFIDAGMKNLKQDLLDEMDSFGDLADHYERMGKRQSAASAANRSALSELAELQLSDTPLNSTQKEQQRQAVETLRKSYRGLRADIDAATGKLADFEKIQSGVLSRDRQAELDLVQRRIRALEKQNGVAAGAVRYEGGPWSEYLSKFKETYGWGAAQEAGGVQKQNVEKLLELRMREYDLIHSDPAADAKALFRARGNDKKQATFDRAMSGLEEERFRLKYQQLINDGLAEEAEKLKLINEAKKTGRKLYEDDAKWIAERLVKERMDRWYESELDNLSAEKSQQELINRGLAEEAEKLRIIRDLEKQGKKVDEEKVSHVMSERRDLKSLQLQGSFQDQARSLYDRALRMSGRGREAERREALRSAEQRKGSALTDAEKASALRIADLNWRMERPFSALPGDLSSGTNALTARGGFQKGSMMPDMLSVNKAIADYNKQQTTLMQQANGLLRELGGKVEAINKV